jgi:hypothetical protein
MLLKRHHSKEFVINLTEINKLVERHWKTVSNVVEAVQDYTNMLEQYFSLRGSPECLNFYQSVPLSMDRLYGIDVSPNFTTVFPQNLIRYDMLN